MKREIIIIMSRNKQLLASLAIVMSTIIWGGSFVVMKNAINQIEPNLLLAIRFLISCILLAIIFFKRLKKINKNYIFAGAIIGVALFLAYYLQTVGLADTTPGKNAFLTACYCVVVPFLYWVIKKQRPKINDFIAGIICFIGVGLVSLTGSLAMGKGDFFTILGGIMFSVHIVAVNLLSKDKDPIVITILQFFTCAVLFSITALFNIKPMPEIDISVVLNMSYLIFLATAGALLLQNIGQKYISPGSASLLLSLEAVFGVIFSMIFYNESPKIRVFIGFALIFASIILGNIDFNKFKKSKIKADSTLK